MEPFDNPKVRKALNMAIDKQAIIDVVFQGSGEVAKNPIPPTMWSYNDAVEDDAYDPEAARAMLEEEGVTDLSMKIWAMPVQRPYNPNARRMAELIQEDFAQVGVDVEIVSYEWGEYLERSKAEDRDGAVLLGWTGDNGDPDNFLAVLLGCDAVGNSNRANWCHEPFDELIQEAKTKSDAGGAHAALRGGAGHLQGAGALGHDRAFGRVHDDAPRSGGLRRPPARRPYLQPGRPVRVIVPYPPAALRASPADPFREHRRCRIPCLTVSNPTRRSPGPWASTRSRSCPARTSPASCRIRSRATNARS